MAKIRIEDEPNKLFEHEEVKESVIRLSNQWFWRDSPLIVKIDGRFNRKASPLVVKDYKGTYIRKSNAVEIAPNVWADKEDADVVQLRDGSWTAREFTVEVEGVNYLRNDEALVMDRYSRKFILRTKSKMLAPKYYGEGQYVAKSLKKVTKIPDVGLILKNDVAEYINESGKLATHHKNWVRDEINAGKLHRVFWKFQNPNFPHPEHIFTIPAAKSLKSTTIANAIIPYPVLQRDLKYINKAVAFYEALNIRDNCEAIRARLNSFYDEAGPDENTAKAFSLDYETYRGGGVQINGAGSLELSDTFKLTGGMKYTFGVEIETSAGKLGSVMCKKLGVDMVADSSIGAGEYVTSPLHGDGGVKKLKAIMDTLHESTLVDNRNAIHFHIGGATDPEGKGRVTTPNFTMDFGMYAIKLGCQIEDSLFASMPPYRQPEIKYCSGIKKFEGINRENVRKYLGGFVFGPEVPELDIEDDLDSGTYSLGRNRNNNTPIERWCKARYKWLNMVNAFAAGRFKTIEFRIFGATTVFEKAYNYLMTSMAFVWFVENRQNLIEKGGVTLNVMFDEAYGHEPKLAEKLKKFYAERIKRFAEARAEVQQLNNK